MRIGTTLVKKSVILAKAYGTKTIYLKTEEENTNALVLYSGCGFYELDRQDGKGYLGTKTLLFSASQEI